MSNTKIRLQRSILKLPGKQEQTQPNENTLTSLETKLEFGESVFVDNTEKDTVRPYKAYLYVGTDNKPSTERAIEECAVFKAFNSKETADSLAFYDKENRTITNEAGEPIPTSKINSTSINTVDPANIDKKYHILCQPEGTEDVVKFVLGDQGIYINGNAVMRGASWNDYAEYRTIEDNSDLEYGKVVCEDGKGNVEYSTKRLQPLPYVLSNTYGFILGTGNCEVGISGKVLVKVNEEVELGDCVCADKDGYAGKMTREEIREYPDRILGTVTQVVNKNSAYIIIK